MAPPIVLIVGGDHKLAELLAHGLELAGGGARLRSGSAEDAVQAAASTSIDALCVGPGVADPLSLVQRVHAADRDVAAVIVAEPDRREAIERDKLFTAFLGPDVSSRSLDEAAMLGAELSDAAARTRERRNHGATMRALAPHVEPAGSGRPLSARHFTPLLDRAPVGVVTLDAHGRVRGLNRRADEILQHDGRKLGIAFVELFAPGERERLASLLEGGADEEEALGGGVFERTVPDGSRQALELSRAVVTDAASGETMVALQDVTSRVEAERRQVALEHELAASRHLLETVVGQAADAMFVKDLRGRYLLINQAGAGAMGHAIEDVVGRTDAELLSPEAARRLREDDLRVIGSGTAESFEESIGEHVTFLATKVPYFSADGRVAGVLGTARDITARKREIEHSEFLLRAAEAMSSLDPLEAVRGVAEVAVPEFADFCVVSMHASGMRPEPLVSAHADPEQAALLESTLARRGAHDGAIGATVLETGRGELHEHVTSAALDAIAADAEHAALLRGLDIGTVMVVALPATGGPMGTMLLARGSGAPAYDEHDLRFAEELARRAAIAIANARLHTERASVAMTLQRSLLPPSLATPPGSELAVRFHAAGIGVDVGGDFYDAFPLGDGVGVVIGDVCGKGPTAAAVTALARYTIRAVAMDEVRPDRILHRLNEALLSQREAGEFCTAALLRVTAAPGGVDLEMACGGHPLPLILRADGSGEVFGPPGTLLGAVEQPPLPVGRARLGPGDACILYTDGLNEAAAPRLLSSDNLLALLRPVAGHGAEAIADRLDVIPATAGDRMRDDTAVVVVSVPAAAGDGDGDGTARVPG